MIIASFLRSRRSDGSCRAAVRRSTLRQDIGRFAALPESPSTCSPSTAMTSSAACYAATCQPTAPDRSPTLPPPPWWQRHAVIRCSCCPPSARSAEWSARSKSPISLTTARRSASDESTPLGLARSRSPIKTGSSFATVRRWRAGQPRWQVQLPRPRRFPRRVAAWHDRVVVVARTQVPCSAGARPRLLFDAELQLNELRATNRSPGRSRWCRIRSTSQLPIAPGQVESAGLAPIVIDTTLCSTRATPTTYHADDAVRLARTAARMRAHGFRIAACVPVCIRHHGGIRCRSP